MRCTDMVFTSASPSLVGEPPPPRRRSFSGRCVSLSTLQPRPVVGETLARIRSSGVIACLRARRFLSCFSLEQCYQIKIISTAGSRVRRTRRAKLAMEAARAAISGGISVLEIVASTPGVFEVVQQLVHDYPTTVLGVGTVLNIEDAEKAARAGAKFLMSPAMVRDVMDGLQDREVLYIPGAMTPTEILSAYNAGAKIVKVYPVSALGGVQYISAIKKPFSHIPIVASQGITIDSVGEYIVNGASSVVLSDAIFDKEAMSQNNFKAIYELAHFAALQGSEAVEREHSSIQILTNMLMDSAKAFWSHQI